MTKTKTMMALMGILTAGLAGLVLAGNVGPVEAAPVLGPLQALVVNPSNNPANVQVQGIVRMVDPGTAFQFQNTNEGANGQIAFSIGTPEGAFRVENVNGIVSIDTGERLLAVIRVVNSEANGGYVHFKYLPLQLASTSSGVDTYMFNADIGLYAFAGARIEFIANAIGFSQSAMAANVAVSGRQQLQ